MSPSIKKYYQVQDMTLYNVITTVIKEYRTSFYSTDLHNLSSINHDFSKMIPNSIRWLALDFSPLCEHRYDYESQATISSRRVEMASAAMIHFDLDPGKCVRWLGGKYTGARRDVNRTLTAVRDHMSTNDFNHKEKNSPRWVPLRADLRQTSGK